MRALGRGEHPRERFCGRDSPEVWDGCKVAGELCNVLARSYMEQGSMERVYELLRKAETLTKRHDAGRATTFNNLGMFYRRQAKLHAALTYLQKAADMIAAGEIGAVRHFEASYLQSWLTQSVWGDWRTEPGWLWRLSTAHGSKGALGDVGIHIVDFATFAAGSAPHSVSCRTAVFHKAEGDRIGEYTLDANDSFVMHMDLANGAIGTITASRFASGHHNDLRLRIYGDKGGLQVLFERGESHLRAAIGPDALAKEEWSDIDCPPVATIYQRFIAAIRGEAPADPTFLRGAELQQVLDLAGRSQEMGSRSLTLEALAESP